MTEPLKLGTLGQISRSVKDIEQAATWYGEVLGLTHLYTYGTLAFFDCGGVRLFLSQAQTDPGAESILSSESRTSKRHTKTCRHEASSSSAHPT
jgi:catechol 2,3-dioxygenase-like lactoylglutathione lyase family enzyme